MITVQEALANCAADIARAVVDRAEQVLPSVPTEQSAPYFMALWQHGAQSTESTFAELLALQMSTERMDAEGSAVAALIDHAAPFAFLAPDNATTQLGAAPSCNPHVKVRADGTVRGRRSAVVVGQDENGYGASEGADLIRRADMWLHAAGTPLPLLGTEVQSWEQFVTWEPEELELGDMVTMNGAPIGRVIFAPYGAGDSITWQSETTRKRKAWPMRRATYAPAARPDEIVHVPMWTVDGATMRVVKRYRTSMRFTADAGVSRIIGGKAGWITSEPRKAKRARVKRADIRVLSQSDALEVLRTELERAYEQSTEHRVTLKVGDHRVTVRLVPTERRYRCSVVSKEQGSKQSAPRALSAALAFVARHTVS